MGHHHRYKAKRKPLVEFDFSWLAPRLEWRWLTSFVILGTLALYEGSVWKSCSNNIEYHFYKDMRVSQHAVCTNEAETFRHRPEFAQQCESALRATDANILHDNKWKCLWAEQPISLGKWEALALLGVAGYITLRLYLNYHQRLEERRIQTKESRRALEYMHSSTMQLPQYKWPNELPYRDTHSRSPVHIEPYFSD